MHYNFGRVHKTLRVAPAMEAGLSDRTWSLEEIVLLAKLNSYDLSPHFSHDNSCVVLWVGTSAAEIPRPVLSHRVMGQDPEREANEASRVRRIHGPIFRVPVSS